MTMAPSVRWTGALTPILTSKYGQGQIPVPKYFPDPANLYWNRTWTGPIPSANITRLDQGSFSFTPESASQGVMLDSASVASTEKLSGVARTFPKADNSRYFYHGRSYGVAAPVGFHEPATSKGLNHHRRAIQNYTYFETGYSTQVSCVYNASSEWHIEYVGPSPYGEMYPAAWKATGPLPNSPGGGDYWAIMDWHSSSFVSMCANGTGGRNIMAFAVDGDDTSPYATFNKIQCEIHFNSTVFSIFADVAGSTVEVRPTTNMTSVDVDPTHTEFGAGLGTIPRWALKQFVLLSMVDTSLYTSVVGDALSANLNIVESAFLKNLSTTAVLSDQQQKQATLTALEDSVSAMLDDALFAISSAQLWLAPVASRQTKPTASVVYAFTSFKIGENSYIFGSIAVNILLLAAWFVECTRTKFWKGLVHRDYINLEHVVNGVQGGISGHSRNRKAAKVILKVQNDGGHALLLDNGDSTVLYSLQNSSGNPVSHTTESTNSLIRRKPLQQSTSKYSVVSEVSHDDEW